MRNHITVSGKPYTEIPREMTKAGNRITMQSTKQFLYNNGYISADDLNNPNCNYSVVAQGIYNAFCDGVLSLNATKQDGVKNFTPIRVSSGLSGKLDAVIAISTISLVNKFCLARMKNNELVCSKCYVPESLRIDGILAYTQNMYVLTHYDLSDHTEWIPEINAAWTARQIEKKLKKAKADGKIEISDAEMTEILNKKPLCRLESMGDIACTLQAKNYLTIANSNDDTDFALWTKNPAVLAYAIDETGKPGNLSTVLSMSRKNQLDPAAYIERYKKYFDHAFVVADDKNVIDGFLSESGFYPCRCDHFSCIRCRRCYMHDNPAFDCAVEKLRDKKIK